MAPSILQKPPCEIPMWLEVLTSYLFACVTRTAFPPRVARRDAVVEPCFTVLF